MENGYRLNCRDGIAPLDPFAKHGRCDHSVVFYKDSDYLLNATADFVARALSTGDPAIVIGTEEHRDGVVERLYRKGLDVGEYWQCGSYLEVDAASALPEFMVDDQPDPERFLALLDELLERARKNTSAERRVAIFGEMVALLWREGKQNAAICLEELWNAAARTHLFSLLCAYPFDLFPGVKDEASFRRVCATHTSVVPGEDGSLPSSTNQHLRSLARLQTRFMAIESESSSGGVEDSQGELLEEESLRRFSSLVLRRQEEERRRVGEDLLDNLGQYLSVLGMNLASLRLSPGEREDNQEEFGKCLDLVEESIREVRAISYLLYPPLLDEVGLRSAIPWYLNEFTKQSGIRTRLSISPDFRRLSNEASVAIFRVLQEALTNVQRHSGSATAEVQLTAGENSVVLVVRDAGKGFPRELLSKNHGRLARLGMGIRAMNERMRCLGGGLEIASSGNGVTITATIPVALYSTVAASA
jgi:signal transduction histidine kinase